jgi:hypothetical protein
MELLAQHGFAGQLIPMLVLPCKNGSPQLLANGPVQRRS